MNILFLPRLFFMAAALLATTVSYSQFKETMGTMGTSGSSITAHSAQFSVSTILHSGTGDMRTTSPSMAYGRASGSFNTLLQAQETFEISDIDASMCTTSDLLFFGIFKTTVSSTGIDFLVVEYSIDNGVTWVNLPYAALPTGPGNPAWFDRSITLPAAACVANLHIRFRNILVGSSSSNPQFRIDDIEMTCGN